MNKLKIVLYFFAFALSIMSKAQQSLIIEKKVLPTQNSTSHVFRLPVKMLNDTLVALFNFERQFDNPILKRVFSHDGSGMYSGYQAQTVLFAYVAKDSFTMYRTKYFEKPDTQNDVYVDSYINPWNSPLYHYHGKPLSYTTPFILSLKSIDNTQTLLTIEAENANVFTRIDFWDQCFECGPLAMDLRTTKVQPTTIEEHTLLLYIADKLGDPTVEPLTMPVWYSSPDAITFFHLEANQKF